MVKKKLLILGALASIGTAIIGSAAFKKRKDKKLEQTNPFIGTWTFKDPLKSSKVLTVTSNFDLFFNQIKQEVHVQERGSDFLIFIDQFGYTITFEQKNGKICFNDETEETTYELFKIH